jgi:Zn-dependent protease
MIDPSLQDAQRRRLENLQAVLAGPAAKPGSRPPTAAAATPGRAGQEPAAPGHHRARNTLVGGAGAVGLFILGKLKFLGLLAGVFKLNTLATMILSVGLYAIEWGVPFAVGFVLLIFVHECGHAIVLRREGIPAGAPVFIPFLGAVIAMRGMPRDAYVEAKVGLGGPVLGSLAAWAVLFAGHAAGIPMLVNIGHAGILINLFNLIPVAPLDGGRIAGAFSRSTWLWGYAAGVLALALTRSPLLLVVLVAGLFTLWRRWNHPVPGYHDIPARSRMAVGVAYAVLVVALAFTLPAGLAVHPDLGS